jgi:two-component system, NtrC family, response regulator AtoC
METEGQILVVDDDRHNREMLGEALQRAGFHVVLASGVVEAMETAGGRDFDAIMSDIKMSPLSGMDLLQRFRDSSPETPVVLLTAFGSLETAIQAMKQGAFDYITKPVNLDELALVMNRAVQHHRLVRDHRHLSRAFDERVRAASFVGQSQAMVEVFKLVGKVAPGRTSVLIQGESGTGKEVIARAIHDNSSRAARLFVAVNCSAIPDALLESELFGHVKGSFTGADAFRRGLLEEASGGTLFLDEVADLSPSGQAKLLRALQEQEIRRVGSNETVKLDLRVISASRRNLHQLVSAGRFREDLLYRLNTVTTTIPPLRERPEDIPLLAELFLARYGGQKVVPVTSIASDAMRALQRAAWPGNVRELEHVIERAVALATHAVLPIDHLPLEIREATSEVSQERRALPGTLDALQREQVLAAYEATGRNKEQAARRLGISRRTLYRLLEQYGLHKHQSDSRPESCD